MIEGHHGGGAPKPPLIWFRAGNPAQLGDGRFRGR
jgi:hypothetical protein